MGIYHYDLPGKLQKNVEPNTLNVIDETRITGKSLYHYEPTSYTWNDVLGRDRVVNLTYAT